MQYNDINKLLRVLQMALLAMCKHIVSARERLVADVASVIDYEMLFFHVPQDVPSVELYATGIPFTREARLFCAFKAMVLEVSRKLMPTK